VISTAPYGYCSHLKFLYHVPNCFIIKITVFFVVEKFLLISYQHNVDSLFYMGNEKVMKLDSDVFCVFVIRNEQTSYSN
ncbi:MAG: hypothetical protein LBF70_01450, partial [Holosporales bacterium]|nr:hypothetical protein [Holosporales bacterium]